MAAKSQTQDVATTSAIAERYLAKVATLVENAPIDTGDDGQERLLLAIMNSETIEDMAAVFGHADNGKTMIGVPLMIRSFVLRESDYDATNGLPFYMTITADNRDTGSEVVFNTGAASIMVSLLTAYKHDWLPLTAHIEAKTLRNNNVALNLVFDE